MIINRPEPVVEFKDVTVSYQNKIALENISFTIGAGEFWGILGPNGSGKTTLLNTIIGLQKPDIGSILVYGQKPSELKKVRDRIGYVPQQSLLDSQFPISVKQVVMLGRSRKIGVGRRPGKADQEAVDHALQTVEMTSYANHQFGRLSGGQKQRVLIARALAVEPSLLLLDEPTSALDVNASDSFYGWLKNMQENLDLTLVLVTHDIGVVSSFLTNVACLNQSLIAHGLPDKVFTDDTLAGMYGCDAMLFHHGKLPHMVVSRESHSEG